LATPATMTFLCLLWKSQTGPSAGFPSVLGVPLQGCQSGLPSHPHMSGSEIKQYQRHGPPFKVTLGITPVFRVGLWIKMVIFIL
jgi:hypothetical protein